MMAELLGAYGQNGPAADKLRPFWQEVDAQVPVEALRAQHAGVDISQEATYSDRPTYS